MTSAAEQLAANLNLGVLAKATELKKRIWFTLGALIETVTGRTLDHYCRETIFAPLGMIERAVFGGASLLLIKPGSLTDVAGVALVLAFGGLAWLRRGRAARR